LQEAHTYDAIYQLTYADYPIGQNADTAYTYDSVFNRTSVNNGSVTGYTVNGLNQYTAVGSANLTYDNNGNLTSDGVYTYEYDSENRLLAVREGGTAVVSYNYNASGRRVSKTVYPTGQYIEYCYDGDQVIAEYDGSGTLLRKYIYGPGVDEPVCMITVDGQTESRYYYHYDGLGSVVALSNLSGTIVERYRYSAFGQTQILSPNYTPRTASLYGNSYMFTGRELDTLGAGSWQLYYYRARFYGPAIGRFLQTDPIGYADGLNWYAYCGNNPINFVDPYGELPEWAWRILAGMPTAPQAAVDYVAGAGDNLSFGTTKLVRKAFDFNDEVNTNSGYYTAGEWTGTAISTATGIAGGIKAAGTKVLAQEANAGLRSVPYAERVLRQVDFSHWIPDRILKRTGSDFIRNTFGKSILNGNYVPKTFHALTDSGAYRWMPRAWKSANPMLNPILGQYHRIPNIYKGAIVGFSYSTMSKGCK
jgi:RHS repeat-associated protein